jgi:serine/threonine protein phosphatase PrpC
MISVLVDQGARPYQEDRHYIEKNFFLQYDLYCVFDGHGNDSVSVFLQMYFKDVLRNELFAGHNTQTISMSMFNACKKLSEILLKLLAIVLISVWLTTFMFTLVNMIIGCK